MNKQFRQVSLKDDQKSTARFEFSYHSDLLFDHSITILNWHYVN